MPYSVAKVLWILLNCYNCLIFVMMKNFKTTFILIAVSTLGMLMGLVGIVHFYPIAWVASIAFALFDIVLICQLLLVEESDFDCALRKTPAFVFSGLGLFVACILISRDTPVPLPLELISVAKNLCFWLVLFEIYLFVKLYTPTSKNVGLQGNQKVNCGLENERQDVSAKIKKQISRLSLSKAERELDSLIGLGSVKKEILSLKNLIVAQNKRLAAGLPPIPMSYHCVFTGNPGTGKTTVARIVAQIYKDLGVIEKGHLIECDRSMLVAGYAGQTAIKTNEVIDSALGGVLFIDEAYTLARSDGQDTFGQEAIDTLLKRMEDDRDRLVVIVAGYTDEMKRFIGSNPGLSSRFNRYIDFPDYSADDLFEIFRSLSNKQKLELSPDFEKTLMSLLQRIVAKADPSFGNGRGIRNLYEKTLVNQANRLGQKDYEVSELMKLLPEDLPTDF